MKNRFYLWLTTCLVLLLGITLAVPAMSADTSRPGFTEADSEYYLPEDLFLLIAPGIDFTLIDFAIPADRQPEVTFTVTDPVGDALEPDDFDPASNPLREVNLRFMLTYIPLGEENKVKYTEGSRDQDGVYTDMGNGVYMYKFATVLPEDYETDATHTLASVATRDLRTRTTGLEPDLGRYFDNDVYNFVPSGAGEAMPRDIVVTETCNNCHNPLGEHGGRYMEVQVCTQCHNPDYLGGEGSDLSYEFSALVHRIHSSQEPEIGTVHYPTAINDCQVCHTGGTPTGDMPLVANPNPVPTCDGSGLGATTVSWGDQGNAEIRINGTDGKLMSSSASAGSTTTGNWVRDGMTFYMVDTEGEYLGSEKVDLTVYGCAGNAPYTYANADGTVGAWHSNWMTRPSRVDCGSCHMNIDWETGEGHAGGPAEDDEFCSFCHQADSRVEFDRSVKGAHTVPLASSALAGVFVDIKEVTNTGPGQMPTVVFSLTSKSGRVDPATLDRLLFSLHGPNEDFDFYAQEDVVSGLTAVAGGWSYTFNAAIPMDAEGSFSVGFEGRITTEVNGEDERDSAENYIVPIAVTDASADPRRMIVDDAKCEACHSNLSLHGDNRKNATEYCQTCHMPGATDVNRRLEGEPEGIHFKYMIHKIHRGADLENLPYIVYGFGNRPHDYSEVHFPGDLRDCESCHVEDSYLLGAIPEGALPTHSPAAAIPDMEPITATCLSCHDSDAAASHALANLSDLGESCATCHGDGKTYSVERVHAR